MPAIPIADKVTLDAVLAYVDELESRLTAIRAGYLDYLNNLNTRLTDTRAGKLDLIGSTGDAAGQSTIFAYLKRLEAFVDALETDTGLIKGYTDTIETLIGTANPLTKGTDTIFKYLKRIDLISRTIQTTAPTTGSHLNHTIADVTGAGFLIGLGEAGNYTMQIDGGNIYTVKGITSMFPIRFNSALVVKSDYAIGYTSHAWITLD